MKCLVDFGFDDVRLWIFGDGDGVGVLDWLLLVNEEYFCISCLVMNLRYESFDKSFIVFGFCVFGKREWMFRLGLSIGIGNELEMF